MAPSKEPNVVKAKNVVMGNDDPLLVSMCRAYRALSNLPYPDFVSTTDLRHKIWQAVVEIDTRATISDTGQRQLSRGGNSDSMSL